MQNNEHFLTESPIGSALFRLAMPIMASSFFSTLYNLTDMLWIGKLGSTAVAAIGAGGMFLWFSNGISNMARMGGQVHTAQSIGRGEDHTADEYSWGALYMAAVFGIVLGLICVLFPKELIRLLQIREEETVRLSGQYLRITGGLLAVPFMNYVLTGLYTARGNSTLPLIANTAGLLTNMTLDPLLVLGVGIFPRLEVRGAAIATVAAQCVTLIVFIRHTLSSSFWPPVKVPSHRFKNMIRMGFPASMQSCCYCFFSMVLTSLCAGFGSGAVAVQRLGGQIESITWNAADGFGSALNAFTGQNYGAGKYARIRKGFWFSIGIVAAWGTLFTVLFRVFPTEIANLFFYEEDVILICVSYLVIVGLSEPFMSAEITAGAALCGLGKTAVFSAVSILLTGCRIPLAWVLMNRGFGLDGIWWALTLTSISKGIVLCAVFLVVCRKFPDRDAA